MKNYTSAPLPFMGQKRRFLKELAIILKEYPDDAIYIDLFGGSGLLSHYVKSKKPRAKVVYNDFDDYVKRLANVESTNKLLRKIRVLAEGQPRDKRITGQLREMILKEIEEANREGYVDYVTLSSSLCFSMNYVNSFDELKSTTLYNVVKQSDYDATGYLNGVERVKLDYKDLFNRYKDNSNVVFLVDPPYLSTTSKTYSSDGYWKLSDYLDVLQVLKKHPYMYFTSNKSSIVELCEWMGG
ncbi:DNA adenine methylase [Pedobacter sp. MW01-1-1]|uniref:DNA adenine methylase n=1 Tax=Pedobacter sp. MW01-1-1 TaxID=3383027 RepID=UPI003FED8EA8